MSTPNSNNQLIEVVEVTTNSIAQKRTDIPGEVKPVEDNGLPRGVEVQALALARAFMGAQGQLARKCYRRGELSHLYVSTFESWVPEEVQKDKTLQRPFKQILFALAHGMKLVRVIQSGRQLLWNRYRDNTGTQINVDNSSTERLPRDSHDDSRPGHNNRPPRHGDGNRSRHRDQRRDGNRSRHREDHRDQRRDGNRSRHREDHPDQRRDGCRSRTPSTDRYEKRGSGMNYNRDD